MTFACIDCTRCGKCYEKNSTCARCGGAIYLLDDACPACGEAITEAMRTEAKRVYIDRKKREKEVIIALSSEAKERRAQQRKKVVYPWEQ